MKGPKGDTHNSYAGIIQIRFSGIISASYFETPRRVMLVNEATDKSSLAKVYGYIK